MSQKARRATTEEDAALYDSEVVPRYTSHFAQLILEEFDSPLGGTILDVGCGTGHPTFELLSRIQDTGRVVAIDNDGAMVDVARRRAHEALGTRVFFKVADVESLQFGDGVFDTVVGNLLIGHIDDPPTVLAELLRVLVPGGRLLVTRPLQGTFQEVLDMFREVALRRGIPELRQRTDEIAAKYPTLGAFGAQIRAAGFSDVKVRERHFRLPFRNARSLFTDPVVRAIGIAEWRWIAGLSDDGPELVEEVERCLNIYFGGGALSLSVNAGLVGCTRR